MSLPQLPNLKDACASRGAAAATAWLLPAKSLSAWPLSGWLRLCWRTRLVRLASAVGVLTMAAALAGCGSDVSVCLDYDEDPPSCEICANGKDDDLDGRVDCRDSDCRDVAGCASLVAETTTATLDDTVEP